jgi:small subunit ribosomal protein S11
MGKKRIIQKTEAGEVPTGAGKKEISQGKIKIQEGRIYINSTYNNTIMTLTDLGGNVFLWVSAGHIGFKGTKKSTPFAASKVAEALVDRAKKIGLEKAEVTIKGIGSGRESALRSLANKGIEIVSIKDATSIPHNGCRPPKMRRV